MMSSNTSDPVTTETATEVASPVENSATETPIDTPPPAKETKRGKAAAAPVEAAPPPETPAVPAYQPNWKYKVFGKEKDLDEYFRPFIKDQDSEKKFKDVFTRADAFDDMKSKHEAAQQEFSQLVTEHAALDRDVKRVMKFRNDGDLTNFFNALKIPRQQIFDWVQNELSLENLPPQQRQALESQALERQQRYDLEQEKTELETQYQTQAVQVRTMQLDMTLSRPDVMGIASAYDTKMGRIGAFRDLVVEEGQRAWFSSQQDLSAEQATQLVIQKFGKLFEGAQAPQAPIAAAPPQPQVATKPVIPAVQGRGTSPVQKSFNSVQSLRDEYKRLST